MARYLGFTESEWRQVERGVITAKTLKSTHGREVASLGAARTQASAACFIAEFEDIEAFRTGSMVRKVRKLSDPPRAADFAGIALDQQEAASLRDCQPGRCALRLPASAMAFLRQQDGDVNAAYQQWLAEYVQSYLVQGNRALVVYHDKAEPVGLAGEFQALLESQPALSGIAAEFYSYLARYPEEPLEGVSSFLYWAEDNFGLKPVISVTHALIYRRPGLAVIASKQIYANHYFDGSLGLTFLIEEPGQPGAPVYIVYLNRSRIDLLSGWLGGLKRVMLRRRLLDGFKQNLRDVVRKLDPCPEAEPAGPAAGRPAAPAATRSRTPLAPPVLPPAGTQARVRNNPAARRWAVSGTDTCSWCGTPR